MVLFIYLCLAWQPSLSGTYIQIFLLAKATLMLSNKLDLIAKQIARLGK